MSSHDHEGVPDQGSALTAGLFVCPFYLVFFPSYTFNQDASSNATIGSTRHWWFSGRILIYQAGSPSAIPASTFLFDYMD